MTKTFFLGYIIDNTKDSEGQLPVAYGETYGEAFAAALKRAIEFDLINMYVSISASEITSLSEHERKTVVKAIDNAFLDTGAA